MKPVGIPHSLIFFVLDAIQSEFLLNGSLGGKNCQMVTTGNNDNETPDEQEEPRVVSLQHHALWRVNFASAQNDVAIIEEIRVENPTDEALTDIRITLRAAPPVIREKTWTIDRVAPGSHLSVRDISTPLDIERLKGLDEAEIGELEFRMEAQGLQTIVEKRRIELLARDEWGGVRDMAQILAAFVLSKRSCGSPRPEGRCTVYWRAQATTVR